MVGHTIALVAHSEALGDGDASMTQLVGVLLDDLCQRKAEARSTSLFECTSFIFVGGDGSAFFIGGL